MTWNTNLIELQITLVNVRVFELIKMYGTHQNSKHLSTFSKFYVQAFWNVRPCWLVNPRGPQYLHFWRVAIQENLESSSTPQPTLQIPHSPECLLVFCFNALARKSISCHFSAVTYPGCWQVLSSIRKEKSSEACQGARDFNNIETQAVKFFFSCKARRQRKLTPFWQKH